ncbi:MAG: response regulator [Thermodesulfobacteriota bacterium]
MAPDRSATILVVDDKAGQDAAAAILRAKGFTTLLVADNAPEAWKLLHQNQVKLVLCELVMPQITGIHLLRKIRADKALSGLPVILMSAVKDPRLISAAVSSGATDYLVKPFDPDTLERKVEAAFTPRAALPAGQKKLLDAGEKLIEQYRYDDAVKIYSKALKEDPMLAAAYHGLARVFKLKNDKVKHRAFLERAVQVYAQTDKFREAEDLLKDMRKHYPDAGNPFKAAGEAHLAAGKPDAAARALLKALELSPEDLDLDVKLARAYQAAGQDEQCLGTVMRALKKSDASPEAREIYAGLTGEDWDLNPASVAGKKRIAEEEEYEKKGTVKFWTPDLLISIRGRQNMPIVAMSPSTVTFSTLDQEFEVEESFSFDIVRLDEGGMPHKELEGLKAKVEKTSSQAVKALFDPKVKEKRKEEIMAIILAAQIRVKEELKKMGNVKDFEVDMLFT